MTLERMDKPCLPTVYNKSMRRCPFCGCRLVRRHKFPRYDHPPSRCAMENYTVKVDGVGEWNYKCDQLIKVKADPNLTKEKKLELLAVFAKLWSVHY